MKEASDHTIHQIAVDRSSNSSDRLDEKENVNQKHLTANPGDRIAQESQTIEEKAKQLAVDSPDITGEHLKVPTYWIIKYPNGEKKALHHVKDAEEISDFIRVARMDENGNRIWW
jgi:hypothetical protein